MTYVLDPPGPWWSRDWDIGKILHTNDSEETPMNEAALPYAGTEGYSGTETSQARAEKNVDTAADRQQTILTMAGHAGVRGITVVDVRDKTNMHHGTASGSLTALHKVGFLVRLEETRDNCKIYVKPQYVQGRPTEKPVSNNTRAQIKVLDDALIGLEAVLELGDNEADRPGLQKAISLLTLHRDRL